VTTMKVGMLVRRPPHDVFQSFVDPTVTTRFWFTNSSGPMVPGAVLRWDWAMYEVSTRVTVREVEEDRRIRFEWNDDQPTTVELLFVPWQDDTTYVRVTETGYTEEGEALVQRVADSTGGFTTVLCGLKALLEHDIVLGVIEDHHPKGLKV